VEIVQGISGLIFGFGLSKFLTDPKSTLSKKIPKLNLLFIEILPRLKIKLKNSVLHIHHWIFLSFALAFLLYITASFTQLLIIKGLFLGGILQGFTFKDRFHIIIRPD